MSFLSSLLGRSDDNHEEDQEHKGQGMFPELYNGMTLDLETTEGEYILTGRLSGYTAGDDGITLERLPGGLSFGVRELGTLVTVRGISESMTQFLLKGTVQESTRMLCRLKGVEVKVVPERRHDFRLRVDTSVTMYDRTDTGMSHPEECMLVDISTSGACIESKHLHAEDEVLRLRVKLIDSAPIDFVGEIIRVVECQPGKFRYGFLFAQLTDREMSELTRTLYNVQIGNRSTRIYSEEKHR